MAHVSEVAEPFSINLQLKLPALKVRAQEIRRNATALIHNKIKGSFTTKGHQVQLQSGMINSRAESGLFL